MTFVNEQIAGTVTSHLNAFIAGLTNTAAFSGQNYPLPPYQAIQPATRVSAIAQPTPQYPPTQSVASHYQPPVLAAQSIQPESQIQFRRSPSPPPTKDPDDTPQSQGFLETQWTPEEEATQITTNAPRSDLPNNSNGSDVNVAETNDSSSGSHINKKRKLDTDEVSDARKSSIEGPDAATQTTKSVSDLIDFSEGQNESTESLGAAHPPLDPYEGTPWFSLSRFSVCGSSSVLFCSFGRSDISRAPRNLAHREVAGAYQWLCQIDSSLLVCTG